MKSAPGFLVNRILTPYMTEAQVLYKVETSLPAAFLAIRQKADDDGELTRKLLKERIEETRLLQRLPKDLEALFAEAGGPPAQS